MESQQVDSRLMSLLKDLPYSSRLGTCLSIRLADLAAQLCGCRSTRQVNDNCSNDIDEKFDELMDLLNDHIKESISYLESEHSYRDQILNLSESDIELFLEDTLFNMVESDYPELFLEQFFN